MVSTAKSSKGFTNSIIANPEICSAINELYEILCPDDGATEIDQQFVAALPEIHMDFIAVKTEVERRRRESSVFHKIKANKLGLILDSLKGAWREFVKNPSVCPENFLEDLFHLLRGDQAAAQRSKSARAQSRPRGGLHCFAGREPHARHRLDRPEGLSRRRADFSNDTVVANRIDTGKGAELSSNGRPGPGGRTDSLMSWPAYTDLPSPSILRRPLKSRGLIIPGTLALPSCFEG